MSAVKILDILEKLSEDELIKAIAWKVPKSRDFPEGIKYAFAYIYKGRRIIGYDNERAKSHHKHSIDKETDTEIELKINFKDPYSLLRTFLNEIKQIRKHLNGGENES